VAEKSARPHITPLQAQRIVQALPPLLPPQVEMIVGYSHVRLRFAAMRYFEKFVGWIEHDPNLALNEWYPVTYVVGPARWGIEARLKIEQAFALADALRTYYEQNT
jgi:hypothetical protein